MGPFSCEAVLFLQPSLYDVCRAFCLPRFQDFVIPAFGLYSFTGIGLLYTFRSRGLRVPGGLSEIWPLAGAALMVFNSAAR